MGLKINMVISAKALPIASLFFLLLIGVPANAESVNGADQLLPLETRQVDIEMDPDLYVTAVENINANSGVQAHKTEDMDTLGADFLEPFLDEDGEVNLPLGLTVFDAMGATSVGFGGEF